MKIVLWDMSHEAEEEITFLPVVGSEIYLDEDSEFCRLSKASSFRVVRHDYWMNNKGYNDECSVIVRPVTKAEINALNYEHITEEMIQALPDLYKACEEFVRKVESGEAKSKRSYAEMKAAILKAGPKIIPNAKQRRNHSGTKSMD